MRMGAIASFTDMMGTPVVVANPSTATLSLFGQPTYAAATVTYYARLVDADAKMRSVPGLNGEVRTVAWIASTSTSAITVRSKATLTDGTTPPIIHVEYPRDENGNVHHTKVFFG